MQKRFDLAVIGSGPGGLKAAIQAAKLGKSVAIVEKSKVGGASVHTGTIPSKSLREAALSALDFPAAMKRVKAILETESRVVADQLERNHISFFQGEAGFLGPHRLQAGQEEIEADHFVIATGTRPILHAAFQGENVHNSDSILGLTRLPPSLAVIGAGVIGCEYASIFARLGSKVTLIDRRDELLRAVDPEVVVSLKKEFEAAQVELLLGAKIGPLSTANGSTNLELNGEERSFSSALVCMGRQPNTESLNAAAAGVRLNERGFVEADAQSFRTSAPHIHAVGDVIGPPALAAASAEQGRIAACRIFGEPCPDFPASFPYGIYTIPEISSVGLLEEEAQAKNIPFVVGRARFNELARGIIVGDQNGFIKLLVHAESRQLLGVHAIGVHASELVHIGQAVLSLSAPVDYLVDNVFNYPTFAEAYKVAALHAKNQLKPRVSPSLPLDLEHL